MAKIFHAAHCSDSQLRITDFYFDCYGRVEICSNQRFETFSYYHWSDKNSEVACRELGYDCTLINKENIIIIVQEKQAYKLSECGIF